jgi:hypothetical protein
LGLWAAVTPVESSLGWFFSSTGRASVTASISGTVLAPLVPLMFLAAHADGIEGIAWMVLASAIVTGAAFAVYAHRRMGFEIRKQFRAVDAVLVACGPTWAAAHFVAHGLVGWSTAPGLVIAILAGLTVYASVVYMLRPKVLRGSFSFLSSVRRDLRRADSMVEWT